ncbi:hypothetical protein Tco_1081472 [Tanacetum coccineum]|uniref:Uncharacterized protein n=1 Tax=Tanacetum coccineum TaxID=301880 RepID=A0ABQ5HXP0_9ASTR
MAETELRRGYAAYCNGSGTPAGSEPFFQSLPRFHFWQAMPIYTLQLSPFELVKRALNTDGDSPATPAAVAGPLVPWHKRAQQLEDDVGRLHDELLRLETRLKCCLSPCGAADRIAIDRLSELVNFSYANIEILVITALAHMLFIAKKGIPLNERERVECSDRTRDRSEPTVAENSTSGASVQNLAMSLCPDLGTKGSVDHESVNEKSLEKDKEHASCNLSKARREGRKLTLRKKGLLFYFDSNLRKGEVRIRSIRILIGLGLTWFKHYWFPEELISLLAKPFLILTLPLD